MQRLRKHLCLAFLGLVGTGASSAQSSVTLYGLVDGGLRYSLVSNETIKNVSNVGLAYGTQSGNRWGIRGVESLGGGNSAFFQLESGFDLGNSTLGQSSRMFGRAAWLGLQNASWGDVRLGRMTNLSSDWLVKFVDPFGGDLNQLNMGHAFTSGNTLRLSNVLMYRTPIFSNIQAGLGYSFATGLSSNGGSTGYDFATNNNSRQLTAGIKYAAGPVFAAATYEKAFASGSSDASGMTVSNWNIGATYDFTVFKLSAGYGQTRDGFWAGSGAGGSGAAIPTMPSGNNLAVEFVPGVGYNSYIVGATIPTNSISRLMISWTMISPNTAMQDLYSAGNQNSYNLGYYYDFTKRTNLYAYVGQSTNYATDRDAKSTVVGVGLRHQF